MKKYKSVLAVAGCMLLLTGCGGTRLPDTIEETTLSVDEEGKVTAHLVESFEKDYYDVSELQTMAVEEAAAYNTVAAEGDAVPIAVKGVSLLQDGKAVKVTYQYNNADTFELHTEGVLFYGTVKEAMEAGYNIEEVVLSSVKDGAHVAPAWVTVDAADKHILITDQKAQIYSPYKVTHISEDVVCKEDGGIDTTQAEGEVYILMKK